MTKYKDKSLITKARKAESTKKVYDEERPEYGIYTGG
jgi:hypothetical protein